MDRRLESVEESARNVAAGGGFRPLGRFAERHGSWEIVFLKNHAVDGLDRFVSLAVTEMPGSHVVDFRAGAEAGGRYARRHVWEFSAAPGEFAEQEFLLKLRPRATTTSQLWLDCVIPLGQRFMEPQAE